MTPDELARLIDYLRDKRDRLVRGSTDTGNSIRCLNSVLYYALPIKPYPSRFLFSLSRTPSTSDPRAVSAYTAFICSSSARIHQPAPSFHPPDPASAPTAANQQQELQAKILSIFNSGSGTSSMSSPAPAPLLQGYSSSLGPQTAGLQSSHAATGMPKIAAVQPQSSMMNPRPALRPPGARMAGPTGALRPAVTTGSGINFDNPSVQKALDTLIQSGPINHLVNMGPVGQGTRSAQGMGQSMDPLPMSHYSRHYWNEGISKSRSRHCSELS